MRGPRARLRRARSLFAYWQDGHLRFRSFGRGLTFSCRPITCEILHFFGEWRTPREAIEHFSDYTQQSVRSGLDQLLNQGFLLQENSPAAKWDALFAKKWSAWLPDGSFHFSTKHARYVKRKRTIAEWKAILPRRSPPKLFKSVQGAKKVPLPTPGLPDSEFVRVLMNRKTHRQFSHERLTLETVSQLLSLVWGVSGYLYSPVFGKLLRKTSPSGGARHPGEVYLMALRVKGLRPGLYHYHPGRHHLERISTNATPQKAKLYCAHQSFTRNAAALFLMTAVFERTMWKYDKSRAYRVVLLETGHLCQTFCLVATWLGLAPFCTAALQDTLIEKDLRIDGIGESVLYVAGAGLPIRQLARIRKESDQHL